MKYDKNVIAGECQNVTIQVGKFKVKVYGGIILSICHLLKPVPTQFSLQINNRKYMFHLLYRSWVITNKKGQRSEFDIEEKYLKSSFIIHFFLQCLQWHQIMTIIYDFLIIKKLIIFLDHKEKHTKTQTYCNPCRLQAWKKKTKTKKKQKKKKNTKHRRIKQTKWENIVFERSLIHQLGRHMSAEADWPKIQGPCRPLCRIRPVKFHY